MVSLNTIVVLFFFISISYTGASYANNYALSFDGINDIVKIGHMFTDLSLSDQWTAEAWVKPYGNQASNFQPNIVGFPGRHPNLEFCGTTVQCDNPTKTLAQLRERNGAYFTMIGRLPLPETTNTWYHLSASWDNNTFVTYLNGEIDITSQPYAQGYVAPLNCTFSLCDEGIDIGGYRFLSEDGGYYSGQYFTGLIDEVRVWTVGRSQSQIKATMNTLLSGNELGLLYYWRFDEGKGLLVDSSAFASYGTLGGGIVSAEPRWVESDAPLTDPYPAPPQPPSSVTCNTNDSGLYATATVLSLVFIIVGAAGGIIGYRCYYGAGGYNQLK